LAREILKSGLRFGGLQAYHGRAQHMRSMEERHAVIETAAQHVQHTKRLLKEAGIECPIVTGAGSGTFMLEVEAGAWNEIQCGSYAFMDVDYAKNEWAAPLPRFEHALFVLTTVMSRAADRAIVDAGLKASSVDSGMPAVWKKDLQYTKASDEHGWVEGRDVPPLGDKLLLVPGHCDPTINLYDWYVCIRKGFVEDLWPITARGAIY
jgi:D-serine deaminase-like pyridoxal phosphate-dependent protein